MINAESRDSKDYSVKEKDRNNWKIERSNKFIISKKGLLWKIRCYNKKRDNKNWKRKHKNKKIKNYRSSRIRNIYQKIYSKKVMIKIEKAVNQSNKAVKVFQKWKIVKSQVINQNHKKVRVN